MSEAIRDVTVRVSVQGGKIDKLPDFEKLTTAADAFFRTVDSGMRILKSDAVEASAATAKLTNDLKEAASINLGDLGLGEARAAVEDLATANENVTAAIETAAETQVEASEAVTEAVKTEEKAVTESAFKQIALSERLAAHRRKSTEDFEKQERQKQEAIRKSGQEQQQQLFAATGAIAQALAAGTQFVSTLRLIGGESKEIEELARKFAEVQAVVQGVAAGTQAFNSINQGLAGLQASAAAASTQLSMTGGAATFTQTALIRLAPAAATAQAALGPIAIAIAGISLAIAGLKTVSEFFSYELPDDSERNARQFEKVNQQLDLMRKRIEANTRSMTAQNDILRAELDLRELLAGETTTENVMEAYEINVDAATRTAADATRTEQVNAFARVKELEKQRNDLIRERQELEAEDTKQAAWRGGTGRDPERERRKREISEQLAVVNPQLQQEMQASQGLGVRLSADTIDEYAAAIRDLPKDQQGAFEKVLSDFVRSLQASTQEASAKLDGKLRENEQAVLENQRMQQDAIRSFEQEQNIALRLQGSPDEMMNMQSAVETAASSGNLNAGIDAVAGIVSTEREQELRNLLAEGNLTRERLLEEIADAAEFETEKRQLEEQVKILKQQAQEIQAAKDQLLATQQQVRDEMRILHEELRQTQIAQQAG